VTHHRYIITNSRKEGRAYGKDKKKEGKENLCPPFSPVISDD
jgi:hypothetical protein